MADDKLEVLRKDGGVELMKASAGSGKTYSLAREYIRLLMMPLREVEGQLVRDRWSYRHILAVTFTNKATGEMKSRIIDELDILANDTASSDYRNYLKKQCSFGSDAELQSMARALLSEILNDYGSFHVSTIDSFFQQTLRSFAREIGQVAEYQVELDRDSLVEEASDRVLDSLSEEDNGLLKWLSSSTIEQIEDGRGFNLEGVITDFAKGYMSDDFRTKAEAIGLNESETFSEANLNRLRDICKKIVGDYDSLLKKEVVKVRDHFDALTDLAVNLKKNLEAITSIKYSGTISLDDFKMMRTCAGDGSKCFVGKKAKAAYGEAGAEAAARVLQSFFSLDGHRLAVRNTAKILEAQVYVFRVAESLRKEFDKLLKEKNVLSLNDTNTILRDIIGGTEIPFIYEKLGVKLHHFLLDEFQDTSVIQWDNFMPLLRNSIADGCYNLIVGDVKQSIYRWRDTDWRIIDSRVGEDLDRVVENPLHTNWRSAERIVSFNNDFYRVLSARMDAQLSALEGGDDRTLSRIYEDVRQETSGKIGVPGYVEMCFCDKKEIAANAVKAVLDARDNKHFSLKDIAVIVRTNNLGAEVASALIKEKIDVVTNDSLRIGSCEAVRCVVARLYRCDNPDEATMSFYAGDFDPSSVEGGRSILSLCEELFRGVDVASGDTSYVLAFLDLVRDFEKKNGNSLSAFLKYWEEDGVLKSISSPEGSEAVTVITIHKVKGLDYPCVVLPFPKKGYLMKSGEKHWESPDLEGTELEGLPSALYHVTLSENAGNDLFQGNMQRERRMQYIDTLNMWYVATTRASQLMYMVAPMPSKKLRDALPSGPDEEIPWPRFGSVADALYIYARLGCGGFKALERGALEEMTDDPEGEKELFCLGESAVKWVKPGDSDNGQPESGVRGVGLKYVSYPLGTDRNRLRMSDKSREFFFPEEAPAGEVIDCCKHGSIVHAVLENVNAPSDLPGAVGMVYDAGLVDGKEADRLEKWLAGAIADVESRGWFDISGGVYRNERTIVDPATGNHTRPDRVVVREDGGVEIIDYKTGSMSQEHISQVRGYMDSYRRMGYADVSGYIWYLGRDVIQIDN